MKKYTKIELCYKENLLQFFSKIKRMLILLNRNLVWIIQALRIKMKKKKCVVNQMGKHYFNNTIFVVAPHADDEWIGCSEILKYCKDRAYVLFVGLTGTNCLKSNSIIRENELHKLLSIYGNNIIDISYDTFNNLKDAIDTYKPKYIFVPHWLDWHDEHRKVIKIVKSVLEFMYDRMKVNYHIAILMYQISVPLSDNDVNFVIPMTIRDELRKWRLFLKVYHSQRHMPILRMAMNEYINGKYIHASFGQVFCEMSYIDWCNLVEKVYISQINAQLLKTNLNDLFRIRECIYNIINEQDRILNNCQAKDK